MLALSWPLSTSEVLFLETPKAGTVLILLPEINDFLQNRGPFHFILRRDKHSLSIFPLIFPGVTHALND